MTVQQRMNRRTFIGMLAAGAGASFFSVNAHGGERKRPNIVVILPDDLGWADIGYNGSDVLTPNLDRLAKQSVLFERQYVMPTCTPTRVGFITGRYPSRYGVLAPAYGKIFDDDTVTLARALHACGYATAISGKWHMGSPPEYTPLKYGFDSSYGYFHGQVDPYTHYYKTGVRTWHRNDQYLDEKGHATDLITDEAVRIINLDHDKPFFLYVTYSVPHFPLDEPQEWLAKYEGRIKDPSRLLFAASVTHMDYGIGRIIHALDRRGLRENTLIVFISDNGGQKDWHSDTEYKGRYANKPHTVLGNNEPLRGWKGEVYEGGIRVPAMANWPGVLKPGTLEVPLHIVDWMPTLCGLAGYVPQKDLKWDGRDMWPSISKGVAPAKAPLFYWKTPNAWAVRRGDWKLVVNRREKEPELYNVTSDPYEEHDMARKQPDRVNELKKLLAEIAADDR